MTKIGRVWRDWKEWRTARKLEQELYPPRPEPRLNVFETFLHLKPWQRVAMILSCIVCYVLSVQGTFSANVLPHLQTIIGPDGRFSSGEAVAALYLSSSVIFLSASPVLMLRATWFERFGLILLCLFIGWTNINYACATQKAAREARNDGPRQKVERIHRLDGQIEQLTAAFRQVPEHRFVTESMVQTAEKAADELGKSAADECGSGRPGSQRGPKCDSLERRRDARLEEVSKFQADKDLTDRATNIEAELWKAKEARKTEGAEPERDGTEMEPFPAFLAALHLVSNDTAQALSDNRPITDAITMELEAWFGASLSFKFIFWIFSLMVCTKTEADRRVSDFTKTVMEERAKVIVAEQTAPPLPEQLTKQTQRPANDEEAMEPDHAAILGIEGEERPAFVDNPQTDAEVMAAAFYKADPEKKPRKARKRTPSHRSSVVQWAKERTFRCQGRNVESSDATADYKAWCANLNIEPVSPATFGNVMRDEVQVEKKKTGGSVKYLDIGLRPAALRVVSG